MVNDAVQLREKPVVRDRVEREDKVRVLALIAPAAACNSPRVARSDARGTSAFLA